MNVYATGMPNELLRLQKMHNGEKAVATFSAAEMTRRQDGLRSILAELKLDAAVLTSYHNICYFSDFICRLMAGCVRPSFSPARV
jgi:creatinase